MLPLFWLVLPLAGLEVRNLADFQVIQREAGGAGPAVLAGTAASAGTIQITVSRGGTALPGLSSASLAQTAGGEWQAALPGIPAGGPYDFELTLVAGGRALGRAGARNVLVGDLWVLAGQSNMVGRALLEGAEQPDERVHALDKSGNWALAREPLHETRSTPAGPNGAGLGLAFAKDMVRRTGVPIGLIPCAVGGTSLWEWAPELKLYTNMLQQVRRAGGRVRGVLWYQGEADSREDRAPEYAERFRGFVARVRADFGQPDLPFYYAQIARYAAPQEAARTWHALATVREAQRLSEAAIAHSAVAATIDLEMQDHVHVNTGGLRRLGLRFARLACKDLFPEAGSCRNLEHGPRPAGYRWEAPRRLRITFTGVNGRLAADGRVLGFSLHDAAGAVQPLYHRAWIPPSPGNQVILEMHPSARIPQPLYLWYGHGADPPCNLRDAEDMAVPTFGPIELPPFEAR